MFYHVYILFSLRDKKFYIGLTTNLPRRISQHNLGYNTSTSHRRPLQLIFYESYFSRPDAERRERYFKSSKGKTVLRSMLNDSLDQIQKIS